MKNCPTCGSEMKNASGTFRFQPPPNIPGGMMIVQNAVWKECENCGDRMLPTKLDDSLDELTAKRNKGCPCCGSLSLKYLIQKDSMTNKTEEYIECENCGHVLSCD